MCTVNKLKRNYTVGLHVHGPGGLLMYFKSLKFKHAVPTTPVFRQCFVSLLFS